MDGVSAFRDPVLVVICTPLRNHIACSGVGVVGTGGGLWRHSSIYVDGKLFILIQ